MSNVAYDDDWGLRPHRRGSGLVRILGVLLGLLAFGAIVWVLLNGPAIEQGRDHKVIRVALPPPPPAPPPPKPEVKPVEVKTPPKEVAPQPTPQPVPQPQPQPQAPPTGSDALTARTGAGPANYGLQQGNGGGLRIGGTPGNSSAFTAYGQMMAEELRRAAQNDPELAKDHFAVRLAITVGPDGRITAAHILESSGDAKRDAALQHLLVGRKLSTPPPAGLPPVRVELNTR